MYFLYIPHTFHFIQWLLGSYIPLPNILIKLSIYLAIYLFIGAGYDDVVTSLKETIAAYK